jgi:hypothetical protein
MVLVLGNFFNRKGREEKKVNGLDLMKTIRFWFVFVPNEKLGFHGNGLFFYRKGRKANSLILVRTIGSIHGRFFYR